MARALLEDLHGTIPVVFFPEVFDRHAELLRASGPILIEGTLDPEAERPELLAREVLPLDEAYTLRTRVLQIRARSEETTEERLARGRAVLDLAPGDTPVLLRLALASGAEACLDLPRHRVRVTAGLVRELEEIFGRESVRCRA
jgi:DNA polymerase-3 subunit alpha